tara:strand:- start:727 stop:1617 length:891 start_codon:yes stop_codon:yes gene_type:complete
MKKLLIISLIIFLTSCSTFRVSTVYYDPIYGPNGTEIAVDVIDNEFELARKFQTDFRFRWDFAQYAMNQPYSWYFNNRALNRYNMWNPYSRFDMYINSHNFWMDWAFDYPYSNFGYNWRDPFGFNNYYYGWNHWRFNGFGFNNWNNRYNVAWNRNIENVSYNRGRRGANYNFGRKVANVANNSNIVNYNQPRRNIKSNIDNVVETIKRENRGRSIRVYSKPNNAPDVIIRGNNSINNNNIRINRRPNINSTNYNSTRSNYRSTSNVRSNYSSSRSSNSSSRSSSRSSRGGRGNNNN